MKLPYISLLLILFVIPTFSCDDGFEELNQSPDLVAEPSLDFTLPAIELALLERAYYTNFTFLGQLMYQVSAYGVQFEGYKYPGGGNYHFDYIYTTSLKNVVDFLDKTQDAQYVNYHNIGRILKVYIFHRLTDTYGDVPYFEAGAGYLDQNLAPAYDAQELIYKDMLNELADAGQKFDQTLPMPAESDLIYHGNIEKWSKFCYSLMLRLAMRLVKVDPDMAEEWVNKAVDGGVFESNDDNCYMLYKPNTYYATISNGQATPFVYYDTWKLAAPFVDILKETEDPRIEIYCQLPDGNLDPSLQQGLPPFTPTSEVNDPLESYSVSPPNTFGHYDAPFMHHSFAQVQYLKAEAAVRGWIDEDPKKLYESGVRAAMQQLSIYDPETIISEEVIDQYLDKHPFIEGNALEMINTQYWIETHYNWIETFANWRRSGYPELDESRFQIHRRLTYPASEVSINGENMQEVFERQGPDEVYTRVWWDK